MNDAGKIDLTGTSLDRALWPFGDRATEECSSPLAHHMASPEAMVTDILQSRCVGCRKRIYRSDPSTEIWKTYDDRERAGG